MAYSYARRNELAREKGFRNYYEQRQASVRSRGFASSRHVTQVNRILGDYEPGITNPFDVRNNPVWQSQVPEEMQNSFRLQTAFRKGFLEPLGIGADSHKLSAHDKLEREFFLDSVPDFDWDIWHEYVEEEGESNPYEG